ncbi:MAG: hypothetical protein R3300_15780 [Candidatus Promineifilaceae bacterium]|nr:hypothetical protein [Candidatus Promineifilaceae bacterium]
MNRLVDRAGDFLAERPGALPLFGCGLILLNFLLQIVPGQDVWIVASDLFLHLGLLTAIVGLLLIRPLG